MQTLRRLGLIGSSLVAVAVALTPPAAAAVDPVGGGRVAFERTRHGNTDIYTMDGDGTHVVRLTSAPADDRQPTWSPDGQAVVFASNRSSSFDLWEQSTAGLTRLTHTAAGDRAPAWSPDGTKIAFVRSQPGHADIWLLDVGTGATSQLTHDGAHDANPAWFPDSSTIAYDSDRSGQREIWTVDASDGTSAEVDTGPGNNTDPAVWPGNYPMIAFVSDRSGFANVWMHYPNGVTLQITGGSFSDHAPTWSPFGELLMVSRSVGSGAQLLQMDSGGQSQVPLTLGPNDKNPSFMARDTAGLDTAQANLEQAIGDADVVYGQDGNFGNASVFRLAQIDSAFQWQGAASNGPTTMSVISGGPSDQTFAIAALSNSGECYLIRDQESGGHLVTYGKTAIVPNCTGGYALANATTVGGWG